MRTHSLIALLALVVLLVQPKRAEAIPPALDFPQAVQKCLDTGKPFVYFSGVPTRFVRGLYPAAYQVNVIPDNAPCGLPAPNVLIFANECGQVVLYDVLPPDATDAQIIAALP